MNAPIKKKPAPKFPKAKISRALAGILKGKHFEIKVANSSIGKLKIVRVVTPAWKRLRPAERIGKVLDAVNLQLTQTEQKGILRFSVLTPEEYQETVGPIRKPGQTKAARAKS